MDKAPKEFDGRLRAMASHYVRNAGVTGEVLKDCVQEFEIRWHLACRSQPDWLDDPVRYDAVLRTAIVNHIITFMRGRERRRRWERCWTDIQFDTKQGQVSRSLSYYPCVDLPEVFARRRLFWECVHKALWQLLPAQRRLLIRRYLAGWTVTDLANHEHCTPHAMEQRLVLARKRLRQKLNAIGTGEDELRVLCSEF